MLVVKNNRDAFEFHANDTIQPFECVDDVVIAMDPSKTNFALIVGRPDGTVLDVTEFSGNNRRKGPVEDTTVYCLELDSYLRQYLKDTHLMIAGVEAAITPHKKYSKDPYHKSNMVLTEIRATVLHVFMELFGIHIHEVNNWTWKASQLPENYRGRDQKYSKKYLLDTDPDNPLCYYFEADVTDVYFIYKYLCETKCSGYTMICNRKESPLHEIKYKIVPLNSFMTTLFQEVPYNNLFTIAENSAFYSNRVSGGVYFKVPVKDLPLDMIYKYSANMEADAVVLNEVAVVVC